MPGSSLIKVCTFLLTVSTILVLASRNGSADGTDEGAANLALPDGGAPSGAVSFNEDIQPILNRRCTSCHNAIKPRGQLDLTSPSSYSHLVNVAASSTCGDVIPGVPRVKPGDKEGSMLWRKTRPDPSRCLNPMPNGSAGLGIIAPDDFDKVERWIEQGALDN